MSRILAKRRTVGLGLLPVNDIYMRCPSRVSMPAVIRRKPTDQLPTTPARTTVIPLAARIVMGLLTGACLGIAGGASVWLRAVAGAIGAIAGAFGGYKARVGLVRRLHVPDIAIAIPEDLIAIGLGLFLVSRF
jgi:uncharacterized membrane protein